MSTDESGKKGGNVVGQGNSTEGHGVLPVVDCDVHPILRSPQELMPFVDEYLQDFSRDALYPNYTTNSHPRGAPISQRPDVCADEVGQAGTDPGGLCEDVLVRGAADVAVLHCLYGVQQIHHPQRERAMAHALNCWLAAKWLDYDSRLRGSIVVPLGIPSAGAEEIDYWSDDERFVQVLIPAQSELLYGREVYWPIWEAAERAGRPVCIHLGEVARHAPTSVGWPSSYLEWYVGQQSTIEAQLASIVAEGVFQKFPTTKVVIAELGFAWLPPFMWKLDKLWKGYRADTPWLSRLPSELIREHVRLTTAPCDGANLSGHIDSFEDQVGSDKLLLFSSDYPHWHTSDPRDLAGGSADAGLTERLQRVNPAALYGVTSPAAISFEATPGGLRA